MITKHDIIDALTRLVERKPNLYTGDYLDRKGYQQDYRKHCLNPLSDYREMLAVVRDDGDLTSADLLAAIHAVPRLSLESEDDGYGDTEVRYIPAQHEALEYRHAACDVLRLVLGEPRGELSRGVIKRHFSEQTA